MTTSDPRFPWRATAEERAHDSRRPSATRPGGRADSAPTQPSSLWSSLPWVGDPRARRSAAPTSNPRSGDHHPPSHARPVPPASKSGPFSARLAPPKPAPAPAPKPATIQALKVVPLPAAPVPAAAPRHPERWFFAAVAGAALVAVAVGGFGRDSAHGVSHGSAASAPAGGHGWFGGATKAEPEPSEMTDPLLSCVKDATAGALGIAASLVVAASEVLLPPSAALLAAGVAVDCGIGAASATAAKQASELWQSSTEWLQRWGRP